MQSKKQKDLYACYSKLFRIKMKANKEVKEKNYLEDLQRLQAEFDNYRKRVDKEKQR